MCILWAETEVNILRPIQIQCEVPSHADSWLCKVWAYWCIYTKRERERERERERKRERETQRETQRERHEDTERDMHMNWTRRLFGPRWTESITLDTQGHGQNLPAVPCHVSNALFASAKLRFWDQAVLARWHVRVSAQWPVTYTAQTISNIYIYIYMYIHIYIYTCTYKGWLTKKWNIYLFCTWDLSIANHKSFGKPACFNCAGMHQIHIY